MVRIVQRCLNIGCGGRVRRHRPWWVGPAALALAAILLASSSGGTGWDRATLSGAVAEAAALQVQSVISEPEDDPAESGPTPVLGGSLTRPFLPVDPGVASSKPLPRVSADAAILVEARTGTILYEKNSHVRRPGASTTKIMTALLVLERGDLSEEVTITREMVQTFGSMMNLRVGSKHLLAEILYGILMKSANDGALAAAIYLAGSQAAFADWMNQRAEALGLKDTHYVNPHGHTATNHYTSAYDLARLAAHALANWQFAEIVGSAQVTHDLPDDDTGPVVFYNTNRLLSYYPGASGVKTGTTSAAGKCLVSSAKRGDTELIAVVLHSDDRYRDAVALLDYGFATYGVSSYGGLGDPAAVFRVTYGDPVEAVLGTQAAVLTRKEDVGRVRWRAVAAPGLEAPLAKGELVGWVEASIGEDGGDTTLLKAFPLVSPAPRPLRPFVLRIFEALFGHR